tara:strand:+ start:2782 stop:3240 length:459 start_codon:yes stop_codon:yes gene_type:complete
MKYKCIIYDFDGVMTDNKVLQDENGVESVYVNRSDGLAVSYFKKMEVLQYIVSTEKNTVVTKRGDKLGIKVLQNISNKLITVKDIIKDHKLDLDEVIFVGNDLNDKEVMEYLPNTFCPLDSHKKIKEISKEILDCEGGNGVIMALFNSVVGE